MVKMTADLQKRFEEERERLLKKINVGKEFLYLTRDECVKAGPTVDEILEIVEETLIAHGRQEYEMPAKIGVHPFDEVFYHAMPAYVPGRLATGCKWIECYPQNPQKYNMPQTTSLLTMNETMCGAPVAVMDGTWITAMRTPAVTVLAAAKLHPGAETFGMFGCGVQGVEHVRFVVKTLKKLKKIYVYDVRPDAAEALVNVLKDEIPVEIVTGDSFEHVAKSCEVLSSATVIVLKPIADVKDEWISKGQTIIPCDLNTFWDPKTQLRADKYIVDSTEEHELFEKMGYFPDGLPKVYAQTGEVLAGLRTGRESADELIVCSNIGMSVLDVAVGQTVMHKALEMGLGVRLPF
ncbi:MAG: ornithine cyclodeaminase family protein [Defluviitaleaceae bacterium]|nr:ornithine cyclodeaminase family protein [Defluviitaleaceae bacterium]